MTKYILFVSYQPINKCWGVQYRKGNINHNEVNESLLIAFAEMAKFIETENSNLSQDCTCNDGIPKAQKKYHFVCPKHGEQNLGATVHWCEHCEEAGHPTIGCLKQPDNSDANQEQGTCDFCRNVTSVARQYLHAKNKPTVGDGFTFIRYCYPCGLLEYLATPDNEQFNKDFAIHDATSKLQ